ncbi:MAG TPA: hypothetical protein VHL57_04010 [Flavobacteriales bacterium]|nr:hypothetical protein [Flavobacteriales bacterium]
MSASTLLVAQTPAQMQKMQGAMDARTPAAASGTNASDEAAHPKRTPLKVFATFEDMVADKAMDGMNVSGERPHDFRMSKEWINVVENGATKEVPLKGASFWGFTDGGGQVVRVYDGQAYLCYALGDKCYYRLVAYMQPNMRDWVSDGPTAEIKGGGSLAEDAIEKAGMKEAYEKAKPKREKWDSVEGYQDKLRDRIVVFFRRINGERAVN